jgi:hypothetical protein
VALWPSPFDFHPAANSHPSRRFIYFLADMSMPPSAPFPSLPTAITISSSSSFSSIIPAQQPPSFLSPPVPKVAVIVPNQHPREALVETNKLLDSLTAEMLPELPEVTGKLETMWRTHTSYHGQLRRRFEEPEESTAEDYERLE